MGEGTMSTLGVLKRRFLEKRKEGGFLHAVSYMVGLCVGVLLTPWYRFTRGRRTFSFRGREFQYFVHWYNATFDNERTLEIPLALHAISLASGKRILEVGNVLSHYAPITHSVLDKYEKGEGIIHDDIASFEPPEPYDLIVSISTLEHVGFEEDVQDQGKILRAMENLRRILAPGGRLLATIPVGFNPWLTPLLRSGTLFDRQHYFIRVSKDNIFKETTPDEALRCRFNSPYTFGNGLVIGLIGPWPERLS